MENVSEIKKSQGEINCRPNTAEDRMNEHDDRTQKNPRINHRGEGHGKEQNWYKRDLGYCHQRYVRYAQKIYGLCNQNHKRKSKEK